MSLQMEFDFAASRTVASAAPLSPADLARRDKGQVAYLCGRAAEEAVARHYQRGGYRLIEERWRCHSGEIDLIFGRGDAVVVVEVKASRSHARAAEHLSNRQLQRIFRAASEYLGHCPEGQLTELRIDLATVNGFGEIETREGLFADF